MALGILSPWGIISRLMFVFVGVAVLAAAANTIAERGMSIAIEHQTAIEPQRAMVAHISIAVLIMLLLVCFATVRAVVGLVEDMIAASRKIADGEPNTRVRRGGIKELDTLAAAFNDMAERLARAQALALDTPLPTPSGWTPM
mgnify:CR=1 FL=1